MNVGWEEHFNKQHKLNKSIKDDDLFLHGTSSKTYSNIQRIGFLLRDVPNRNWSISQRGICFERYPNGKGISLDGFIDLALKHYCEVACKHDGSSEGVVLQVNGRELKELGCPIYADWNKPPVLKTIEGIPVDVNSDSFFLSIIVIDCDIPLGYLEVAKRLPCYLHDF